MLQIAKTANKSLFLVVFGCFWLSYLKIKFSQLKNSFQLLQIKFD
jgi:hypothetical protein